MNELSNDRFGAILQRAKLNRKETQYECQKHGIHEHIDCEQCIEQEKLREAKVRNGIPHNKLD